MAIPSPPPVRNPAGATSDAPYQPLADSGYGNPFSYHSFSDDFDNSVSVTGTYTVSKTTTGTVVNTAGDGGLALFTTAAASNDAVSIQLPAANTSLPQGALAGKKLFFLARLQLSDVTNSAFIAGLCNTTATPMTAVSDGVYFNKVSGGTVLNLLTVSGSTALTWAIPTSAYSLANATNIDLAFYVNRYGDVLAFVGSQLVGYLPQSGTGGVNASGVTLLPPAGPCLRVTNGTWTVSAANLNPTLALAAGAAAAKTMTVDFMGVQKER